VQDLSVDARQTAYAGALERALASCELADPEQQTGLSLWLGDTPVGFLVLSRGTLAPTWAPLGSAGVSAWRIDARFQGHGLGQTALRVAEAWLAQHWPACTQLVLSVDESNTVARRACARAGFVPCQAPRPGRDGAVHDLCKRLVPELPLDAG
jgi:RimJ/RimL family protein N-acetyltransferase